MPSFGIDLDVGRVVDREQPDAVEVEHLFQLVRHAQLVAAVARDELAGRETHVLDGIGHVAHARGLVVAHLARAQEVRHELEARAVPGVEIGTRRRLAVELVDGQGRPAGPTALAAPVSISVWTIPETQITRTASGASSRAQPEDDVGRRGHRHRRGGLELLAQAAGTDLHLHAHAALVGDASVQLDRERAVAVAALVREDHEPLRGRHHARPRRRRRRGRRSPARRPRSPPPGRQRTPRS